MFLLGNFGRASWCFSLFSSPCFAKIRRKLEVGKKGGERGRSLIFNVIHFLGRRGGILVLELLGWVGLIGG